MVSYVVLWLNGLPARSGVSDTLYPHTIMTENNLDFNKHFQLKSVAYAKTNECPKPLNSQKIRGQTGIYLGPTVNIQCPLLVLKPADRSMH